MPLQTKGLCGEAWHSSCQDSADRVNCALLIQNPTLFDDLKGKIVKLEKNHIEWAIFTTLLIICEIEAGP